MVSAGNEVLASDINTIITAINSEENDRGVGESDIGSVSTDNSVAMQKFIDMIDRLTDINNHHCNCEAHGWTHNGGSSLSLTADKSDFGTCSCNTNCQCQTACGCDVFACGFNCPCNSDAGCGSDELVSPICLCESDCTCDEVCTCQVQAGTHKITATGINKIDTDITNLAAQCDCDSYTCGTHCESDCSECTCEDEICDCEYGG